ncbi:MAG: type II/IV secretion system ATPase subunit, partial [Nanoarchaeota archaeon]|nr:type II/IV secretion system ATPase subunit [Nanoarchaeota archaeon]
LRDYFVEDIECNGANTPVYIVHRNFRNIKTTLKFKDNSRLESFVEKLAQRCGKSISYSRPILDGSLPDGSRVNATYTKDITSRGPTFTIRKFTKTPWTPPQLIGFNTLSPEMLAYLWLLIEYKMNLLVIGGTASGKTTLLNAISFFIPPEARVVSIEDTRELNLPRENWLPSVARSATGLGDTGEINMYALLKASFRQNPDYVIVGEVRGKEASVLFQGMASGHSSISTIHADSVETVIKRLETPPIELSPTLLNVIDSMCIMTHAIVDKHETRKLREIVEIVDVDQEGVAITNTPFVWNSLEDRFYFKKESKIFDKIAKRYGMPKDKLLVEFSRRTQLLYKLYQKKVFRFHEVQELINEYYKKPEEVLKKFEIQ